MTTAEEPQPAPLPVFLVEWVVPRQRRDPQKAAAAVGAGSLVQLVRTVLAGLHEKAKAVELGDHLPHLSIVVEDSLETVELERIDAGWDRTNHTGTLQYSLDHPLLAQKLYTLVQVPFCPGCLGRGGAHADGCWGSDKPALFR